MAMLAARAGKDVYCEKPFSFKIRWGRATVEAVRRHGRVFQGGMQQRSEYDGRFRRAVELVRGGAIGTLKTVYANVGGGGLQLPAPGVGGPPVPDDVDWDAYVGPLPWFPYTGSTGGHAFGTGSINWGPHHYDIVQWGIGADDTGPTEIDLQGGTVVYRYACGVEVLGCPPPGEQGGAGGATFVGTEGRITVHRDVLTADPPEILRQSPGPEGRGRSAMWSRPIARQACCSWAASHPSLAESSPGIRSARSSWATTRPIAWCPWPRAKAGVSVSKPQEQRMTAPCLARPLLCS
jgi:hypothetical protein